MQNNYAGGHETHEGKAKAKNQATFVYNEFESQLSEPRCERLQILIPIALKEKALPDKIRSIMNEVLRRIETPRQPMPTGKQYDAIFSFLKSYQAAGILNTYQIIRYEQQQEQDNNVIDALKERVALLEERLATIEKKIFLFPVYYNPQTEDLPF